MKRNKLVKEKNTYLWKKKKIIVARLGQKVGAGGDRLNLNL